MFLFLQFKVNRGQKGNNLLFASVCVDYRITSKEGPPPPPPPHPGQTLPYVRLVNNPNLRIRSKPFPSGRNGICLVFADTTVYVWFLRTQRYMSGFCGRNGICLVFAADIYCCMWKLLLHKTLKLIPAR